MDKTFLISQLKTISTYDSIPKVVISQGDHNRTGYLLDYNYFEKCKMIAT